MTADQILAEHRASLTTKDGYLVGVVVIGGCDFRSRMVDDYAAARLLSQRWYREAHRLWGRSYDAPFAAIRRRDDGTCVVIGRTTAVDQVTAWLRSQSPRWLRHHGITIE